MSSPTHGAPGGDYIWHVAQPDASVVRALAASLDCPGWFASLLVLRNITDPGTANRWLQPRLANLGDPFLLPDSEKAAARILSAIDAKERITLFGDYDVDGLTSVALLRDLLSRTGASISTFLPLRLEEGYGLSAEALDRCITETSPDLIITVDCGTNSAESVRSATSQGIDVIVTDHHEIGEGMAPACAVINPRRSENSELHVLAGVGVAFKLAHAILKLARRQNRAEPWVQTDPREFLDLVALGTVADLVPLLHENRILVHHGLKHLTRTSRVGLKALIDVAGITRDIDTYEVGFLLGPRLNASGRLGDAKRSLQLLTTDNGPLAMELAKVLDAENRERQTVERAIVDELKARISKDQITERHAIVEAEADWHPGVVGIVASRLVQQFHRPTVVIGMDDAGRAKGSCRSIAGLNMVAALGECRDLLVKFGGHAMAAGLEIEWNRIPAFRKEFDRVCRELLEGQSLTPRLHVDGWMDLAEIDEDAVRLLDTLRPFGMGYPEPVWAARNLQLAGPAREVGKGHLKMRLAGSGRVHEAIGFGMYHRPLPDALDGAFHLRMDSFRGRSNVVLHMKDFRPSA